MACPCVLSLCRILVPLWGHLRRQRRRAAHTLHLPMHFRHHASHLLEVLEGREYLRAFGQGGAACEHAVALLEGSFHEAREGARAAERATAGDGLDAALPLRLPFAISRASLLAVPSYP